MASSFEEQHHPTIFDPATLIKKGLCTVAKDRAPTTHRLYYEIHGDQSGENVERIVFVMGLNNSSFGWDSLVRRFAPKGGYQVLVFDNRGVGNSDAPKGLYKTTEMAQDVIELLDYVGWSAKRELHVVGVSMGGMISQELALVIPDRIASLTLMSTKAGNVMDLPPLGLMSSAGLFMFGRLLTGTVSPENGVKMIADTLFPKAFLDRPDPDDPSVTKRQTIEKDFIRRFNLARRQPFGGRIGQVAAALRHHVSVEQLGVIATTMAKVLVITGDDDNLINPQRSKELHGLLPGSEYICIEGGGHALPSQCPDEVSEILTRVFKEGRERSRSM